MFRQSTQFVVGYVVKVKAKDKVIEDVSRTPAEFEYGAFCSNSYPANIHLFNVKNRNTRKTCEICSKLSSIKTPERIQ